MKKSILILLIIIFISQLLFACSSNDKVEFKEFYSQIIGFNENNEHSKPIENDTTLMMTNDEFEKFNDKYFKPREIPMDSPDKEKAVFYLQIPSSTSSVNTYSIKNINVKNNTLTVTLEKGGVVQVDGKTGFNNWKWVMFLELDKAYLNDNMDVILKY